jgi:quercetin dioxygenase-like cupin family protein
MKEWQLDQVSGKGVHEPRVLFSTPEARAVVIHLGAGEEMGPHQVRERAIVQVLSGRVVIECDGRKTATGAGTLLVFEPAERHAVHASTDARLLIILAPWPSPEHYSTGELGHDPQRLPKHATDAPEPADTD